MLHAESKKADIVEKAIKDLMPPELRGRITQTIQFNPMSEDMARRITERELKILFLRAKVKGLQITCDDDALTKLAKMGTSESYGAREVKNVIRTNVTPLITKKLLEEKTGDYRLSVKEDKVVLVK